MATSSTNRWTAPPGQDVVVFVIGMRISRWRSVHRWLPVGVAMPRMLRELAARPELGLLHARTAVSGRSVMTVQYWRSFEHLDAYARAADHLHVPAWQAFNRRARGSATVGIFHETYVLPASAYEAVQADMPHEWLLAAVGAVPADSRGRSAAHRLDPTRPDVDPDGTPVATA